MTRARQEGFTLVEMLVAMGIFAIISTGTLAALTSAISGKDQASEKLEALAQLDAANALIKADMRDLILRRARDSFGDVEPFLLSGGGQTILNFTRTGRDNPGGLERRSDLQRVTYLLEDDQFIRRALAHENPAANTPHIDRVLLEDVADVDIRFVRQDREDLQLFAALPQAVTGLHAIRLDVSFISGGQLTQYFEVGL